jgi:tRNA threonylcarbamoyladenosine biosynthesis protein TsaB
LEKGISCRLAPPLQIQQNAVGVALAAEEAVRRGETVSAQALLPVYLRPAQAERLENQRKSKELSK